MEQERWENVTLNDLASGDYSGCPAPPAGTALPLQDLASLERFRNEPSPAGSC